MARYNHLVVSLLACGVLAVLLAVDQRTEDTRCMVANPELLWINDDVLEVSWTSCLPGRGSVWIEDEILVDSILQEKFGCVFDDRLLVLGTLEAALRQHACSFKTDKS